jgi:hypothetical protein
MRRWEKAGSGRLLDAIDDGVDKLEADPGSAHVRRRSFGDGSVGIPVRDRSEDWLIIWERDPDADDVIVIRYLGTDPFARAVQVRSASGRGSWDIRAMISRTRRSDSSDVSPVLA